MTLSDSAMVAMAQTSHPMVAAFASVISTPVGAIGFTATVVAIAWLLFVLCPPRRVPGRIYPGDAVDLEALEPLDEATLRAIAATPQVPELLHDYAPRSFALPAAKGFRPGPARVIEFSTWRRA